MEIIKVKADDKHLRNEMHFSVQLNTRAIVYRNHKVYSRKSKHKESYEY
jgi:hypothetical protein